MQDLLEQICELQEQYRLLTMEEQALVGSERKAKLDALGMLLEEGALFGVDDFFDNEDGLSYKIITENESDNQVSVTTSSNYGALLSGSIQIPSAVEHNGIEYQVTRIDDQAFKDCQQLTSVRIPDSVQSIGNSAFFNCQNLTDITIPNGIQINNKSFEGCIKLSTMKIIVARDMPVSVADANAFLNCPDERHIVFQTPDGTELSSTTTPELSSVVNIYKAAADGNTEDYLWYGWHLKIPTYTVTVSVLKDSSTWQDHDRQFALKMSDSDTLITDLTDVKNGSYRLYDITNAQTPADGLDTQITIEIKDSNASSDPVEYYTVTFFDENIPYGADTPQRPQIILKNYPAVKPSADPVKEGFLFEKWITANGAATEFEFANQTITTPTSVYAGWTPAEQPDERYKVLLEIYLDGEKWTENCPKSFVLKLKNTEAFTTDFNAAANGQYDIYEETSTGKIDTNVDVDVNGADASARIDYYTIQFVDENIPYGMDTPQRPQIILKGQHAAEPEAPSKEGFSFAGWKTVLESDVLYDFANTAITDKISLYATWIPADSGDKPGDGENKPGGGDEQPPGEGENKPGGGDEQQPGDGENKPGSGDEQPPGEGENKPGGGDEQKPDNGNGQKPDDGNDKPGDDGEQQPDNSENKPDNGNQQTPDKDNGQKQNKDNQSNIEMSMNTSTFMITQTTPLPSEDNMINNSIPSEVITDYSSSGPVRDKEPQTGDEASTGIYAIVAMLASLVLILLHFAEYSDKNILQRVETGQKYRNKKLAKQRSSIPLNIHRKHNIQNIKKKDRTFEVIWTRKKQYFFSSG
ncbi:MAG: leucine-rich repeat protein [Lachnospiraceae bacterium]|nr:leucine-rich repeat protein [Lachnospiraceae bacterium]